MRKIGIALAVIVVLVGAGYGLVNYGPAEIRTAVNKLVQLVVPQADPRAALDEAIRQLPPGYTASYKTAEYDVVSDTFTMGGVTLHTADSIDVSVEQLTVVKPSKDFATEWAQAHANPAQVPQDKALPVAASITATGIKGRAGSLEGSMNSTRIDGLHLYPWALLHSGVPSWSEAMAKASTSGAQPTLDNVLPVLRLESALLLGIGYDSYTVDGTHFLGKTVATPSMPSMEVTYDFRTISAGKYNRGIGGGYSGDGATVQLGALGKLTLEHVAISDLDLRKPMTEVLENATLAPEMLDGFAIGKIEYAGMSFAPTGGAAIPIGTLTVSNIKFAGRVPISGDLSFGGLKLSRTQLPDPEAQQAFDRLGLETVTMSLGFVYRWDLDKKRMTVTDLRSKIDELGATSASLELLEVTPDLMGIMQGQLAHAKLRYDDSSGVERVLKAVASENGGDPEALRKQAIGMIQVQGQALGDSPAIAAVVKALVDFLQAPKSLTVELAPSAPVPFTALQSAKNMPPPQIVELLGLKVSANQ